MKITRNGAEHFVWHNPRRGKVRVREQGYWEYPEPYLYNLEVYDTSADNGYEVNSWYCLARYHTKVMAERGRTALAEAIENESEEVALPLEGIARYVDQQMTRRQLGRYRDLLRTAPTDAEEMRRKIELTLRGG